MKLFIAGALFQGVDTNSLDGVGQLLNNAASILLGFVGALAVIMIIVGGIQYITSAGSSDGQARAKKTITYAVGGLVLAISTLAIINLINTLFF